MRNFTDELGINGHLTIIKKYNNGSEEVVFDDHNIIVSGMGVALSYLFTASGSNTVLDYQIDRFQLGVSGRSANVATGTLEVSTTNQLSGALTLTGTSTSYGAESNLFIEEASQILATAVLTLQPFALIPPNKITRINDNSVRYTLVVDEEACNNLADTQSIETSLNEIGLFVKNPRGDADPNASILVAYRTFSNIRKTNDFSLIFRWTLNF